MPQKKEGITIEFRGDTTQLTGAIKKVKQEAAGVRSSLREVDRALKFNPHNVELLTQKQRLLKERVQEATARVKELKAAQAQLDARGVEKTSAEYQKLRREILIAENQQKHFTREMVRFGNAKLNAVGGQITAIGNKLTNVNRRARQVVGAFAAIALYKGFERLKTLDEVSTELGKLGYEGARLEEAMDAATESVSGTKFALTDMARVMKGALGSGVTETYELGDYLQRTADLAQLAGIDVQKMGAMLNKAYSKGKVDARLLNQINANGIPIYKLLQDELGVTAEELSDMTRAGKVGFDDLYRATDKYKGLAQEMGTETFSGAFTVLTQQFGLIGADFLSGVYEPIKDGVKGTVSTLKELRADGTFKAWGESVGQVVSYFVSYLKDGQDSMVGMSEGAQKAASFLKPFITVISEIVKIGAAMPDSIKQLSIFMALFGSPTLKAIGAVTKGVGQFSEGMEVAAEKAKAFTLTPGMAKGGAFAIIAANAIIAAKGIKDLVEGTNEYTRAYNANKQAREDAIAGAEAEYGAASSYAAKLDELINKENKTAQDKQLIKTYVDLLNSSVEGLNLSYNEEKDALNKTTDEIYKQIDAMKQQALAAAYKEQITSASKDLVKAEADLAEEQEHLAYLQDRYNDAVKAGSPMAGRFGGEINASKKKIEGYNKVINGSKKEIEKYSAAYGKSTETVKTKTKDMKGSAEKTLNQMTTAATSSGRKFASNIASGITENKGKVSSASKKVETTAENNFDPDGYSLGASFTKGLAAGIRGAISFVQYAIDYVNDEMEKRSKKNLEINSPSHVAERLGSGWDEGMARGMQRNLAMVAAASEQVSRAVIGGGQTINNTENNKNLSANYTIIVNGTQDPEAYGAALAAGLKQGMRTI